MGNRLFKEDIILTPLTEALKAEIEQVPRKLRTVSIQTADFYDVILTHAHRPRVRYNRRTAGLVVQQDGFIQVRRRLPVVVCTAPGWACARYILDRAATPRVARQNENISKARDGQAHPNPFASLDHDV